MRQTAKTRAKPANPADERRVDESRAGSRQAAGRQAESLAADYLAARGLRLIERNYRCRLGEIDLILADGPALVFVEVRLRRASAFGGAAASITEKKRQRILRAARHYLSGKAERPCRFDALLLDALDMERIEWIRDAFGE
jgi:putative endonuclease